VAHLVIQFVEGSDGRTAMLSGEQRGNFVATAWVDRYINTSDPSHLREAVARLAEGSVSRCDIFDVIEQAVQGEARADIHAGPSPSRDHAGARSSGLSSRRRSSAVETRSRSSATNS